MTVAADALSSLKFETPSVWEYVVYVCYLHTRVTGDETSCPQRSGGAMGSEVFSLLIQQTPLS